MTPPSESFDRAQALAQLETAAARQQLSAGAVENMRAWLTEPRYADYAPQVAAQLAEGLFQELDDAFWTVIPFGTGGRRGKMYPIGSNAINDRTIGESAQGVADYVKSQHPDEKLLACAIAYDTRHRSRHFAELCAGIMAAAGFTVYFLDRRMREMPVAMLGQADHHRLGHGDTDGHGDAAPGRDLQLAGTGPHRRSRAQQGRAGNLPAAGQDEDPAVTVLVAIVDGGQRKLRQRGAVQRGRSHRVHWRRCHPRRRWRPSLYYRLTQWHLC